ncbi:Ubiquinol cytochrome-c reductase assembly protein Cbp3 [Dispira parvispora]|uniref:Ubiquinol cytochrome-c reductase assembly protein Cbp3 n=1 Tax=Dispira parvispora TaxID=1520584 RepID=A0A9W8AJM8_9FUNG|nr:Ubiquinol cytochrome-c reductase assembly protein Cbp3 [Dispira parvispora]
MQALSFIARRYGAHPQGIPRVLPRLVQPWTLDTHSRHVSGGKTAQKVDRLTALKRKVPEETELMAKEYRTFKGPIVKIIDKLFGRYKHHYVAIPIAANIYSQCRDLDYHDFYIQTLGLPDTYQTWFSVTQLHVWMMMVRLRNDPNGKHIMQEMVNHFFHDAETRMQKIGIHTERLVNKTLKELVAAFHGSILAFDEAMCRNDPYLAAALWRNLFKTNHVRAKDLDYLVHYVRRQLAALDQVSEYDLHRGYFQFDMPDNRLTIPA